MPSFNIEKRRSYLVCFSFSAEDLGHLEKAGEIFGFTVLNCNSLEDLTLALDQIQHCLGIFVQKNDDHALNVALIDLSLKNSVAIRFFSDSDKIPDSLRVPTNILPSEFLHSFLQDLVPVKFRELCLFAVKKVTSNLIPDYNTQWKISVSSPPWDKMDFLIFCEAVFDNFICAVTVRSGLEYVSSKSETLKDMPGEDVIEYFNEVSNQVLGIINVNLKKININSRIGLPIVVQGNSIAEFKRRSSYFLPVLTMSDEDSGLCITFQFLVPFLKSATFSKTLDFEIGLVSEDKKLQIL